MPARRTKRRCTRRRIGRVSVYSHHGAWWIYYRDGATPVRRRIGIDAVEAERIAAEVNSQVTNASPTLFAFTPISVAPLISDFLEHHEVVLRSSVATIRRYSSALNHLVDFASSRRVEPKAHELSASEFVKFLRCRRVAPNGHPNTGKRLLRDKGVQFILEVCRSLYSYAQRQRCLPPYAQNPFAELRLDRMRIDDRKPVFVFDEDTELRFLREAKSWEFPIHLTLAKTGIRPGELCHLLIEEVDLKNGWISVRNKQDLGWATKTRNERTIPLITELRSIFRRVIGSRPNGPIFRRTQFVPTAGDFANPSRSDLVRALQTRIVAESQRIGRAVNRQEQLKLASSVWRDSGAFDPDQIRRSFIRIAKRCGLENATCSKSWRHSFATLLQDANVDPLLRQITLGHQPTGASGALGMTGIYSHSRPETLAREIDRALRTWPQVLKFALEFTNGAT